MQSREHLGAAQDSPQEPLGEEGKGRAEHETWLRVGREIKEGKDMGGKRQRVRAQPWSLFHQRRGHPFLLSIAGGCWMS